MLAALVAAFVVPVGFALSLESAPGWRSARPKAVVDAPALVVSSVVVSRPIVPDVTPSFSFPIPDAAKLLVVGSLLIGLAAAVRKAS